MSTTGLRLSRSSRASISLEHEVVGPVEVGQHEHDRLAPGRRLEEGEHRADRLLAGPLRVDVAQRHLVAHQVQEAVDDALDLRRPLLGGPGPGATVSVQPRSASAIVASAGDVAGLAEGLGDRPPHVGLAVGDAAALETALRARTAPAGQPPRPGGTCRPRPRRQRAAGGPGCGRRRRRWRGRARPSRRRGRRTASAAAAAGSPAAAAARRPTRPRPAPPGPWRRCSAERLVRDGPLVAAWVAAPTTTLPGSADVCRRCAVFTTSPMAVYSPPARSAPDQHLAGVHADAHLDRTPPRRRPVRRRASACIRSAARTARSASSSWATGAPKRATMASPMILSTWPPKRGDVVRQALEAPVDQVLDLLGIAALGQRGEADQVGEDARWRRGARRCG